VTQWSSWSPCSVTCGKGVTQRLRYYLNKEDMIRCQRETQETQMCVAGVLDCQQAGRGAKSAGITHFCFLVFKVQNTLFTLESEHQI